MTPLRQRAIIRAAGENICQAVRAGEADSELRPVLCPKRTHKRVDVFFADLAGLIAMAVEPRLHA